MNRPKRLEVLESMKIYVPKDLYNSLKSKLYHAKNIETRSDILDLAVELYPESDLNYHFDNVLELYESFFGSEFNHKREYLELMSSSNDKGVNLTAYEEHLVIGELYVDLIMKKYGIEEEKRQAIYDALDNHDKKTMFFNLDYLSNLFSDSESIDDIVKKHNKKKSKKDLSSIDITFKKGIDEWKAYKREALGHDRLSRIQEPAYGFLNQKGEFSNRKINPRKKKLELEKSDFQAPI